MTGNKNILMQILAVVVQVASVSTEVLPVEIKPVVIASVALVQAILAKIGIDRNPDGKPVSMAYNSLDKRSVV